jgi:hypothetical protein
MNTQPGDLQRNAEERVHRRFERQTAALHEWQREETRRDADFQANAVVESVARQTMLQEQKKDALAAHDKLWNQARDRLTPRPEAAPAYDLMGAPPPRNLVKDYDELHLRSSERREQIVRESDEAIATCRKERGAMLKGFARTNEARDQRHNKDRLDLAQRQEKAFAPLVRKEIARADKWNSPEFNRRGRNDNTRDL